VESSNFVGQDHVSYLVRNFGSERLLFGSFLPMNDPYAAIGLVLDADIAVQERENILGKNLERLIAEVRL
jgi:predicted TIM-barrel fold metal-dependent hydrolase